MNSKRYAIIDNIRGLILISMIIYHIIWDIVYIFEKDWLWFKSDLGFVWQQSICWGFIFLAGFCWQLGRDKLKRGLITFGAGAVVSLVTIIAMPENAVRFGVLTLIGSCTLLMIIFDKAFKKINTIGGLTAALLVSFAIFTVTRNVNDGNLGFGGLRLIWLPQEWYANLFTAYIGFPTREFVSSDYFAIFPWVFLFQTGYFLYSIIDKKYRINLNNKPSSSKKVMKNVSKAKQNNDEISVEQKQKFVDWVCDFKLPVIEWLGRHSLIVYMLHQPVVYGILWLLM